MQKNDAQNAKSQDNFVVKKKKFSNGLPVINQFSAGVDIGDTFCSIAIADGNSGFEVRDYPMFTEDISAAVEWLVSEDITSVCMESTGVYWLNFYLLLEEAGIEPYLVNAKHVKNVTGRKKDDTDAIWLQKLHSCGLLQKSFQPDEWTRSLRNYTRQRKNLVRIASDSVRRMQKALELLNIKIHIVISDILGKTGMNMLTAIVNGERDPDELMKFKDPRIKAPDELIRKSLVAIWNEDYVFMLKQAYNEYMFYQSQIAECENVIVQMLQERAILIERDPFEDPKKAAPNENAKKKVKVKPKKKNQFKVEIRPLLKTIVGVDLCDIPSISEISTLELVSEIGTDMCKWKNHNHFSAWLNVAPNTKITGGKIISSKIQKKKNYAGQTLRMAASSLKRDKSALGDYHRKMRSRLGKKGAVVASAHKLSKIIYIMIKEQKPYDESLLKQNQEKWRNKRIEFYRRELIKLENEKILNAENQNVAI